MTSTQKKMQKKGDATAKSPGFAGTAKSPGFAGLGSRQRKSKEFLIIGAQGMLGRHLVDEFSHRKIPFCAVGRELDVCDLEAVKGLLSAPWSGVINATAYTNVEQAETEEGTKTAFDVNAAAVWNMAKIACENGYPFIHYSTDYVFGQGGAEAEGEGVDGSCVRGAEADRSGAGESEAEGEDAGGSGVKGSGAGGSGARGDIAAVATFQPRKTTDLTHPVNAYARSKDCGEKLALAMHPKGAYIVRCAWLYGLYGRNFVKTMVKLAKDGKSPQVVDDQIGQPTYAKDVARQTILLLRGGVPPGIWHATNAGQCTWFDFAREIFLLCGATGFVERTATASMNFAAARPAYSVLCNDKWKEHGIEPLRCWKQALQEAVSDGILD